MELVSILMTVYNGAHILNESLDAIINQTYRNIEIVIVNDGSTDNSSDIIKSFKEKDDRIIFVDRIENKGRVYSLNEGLGFCHGSYIAINDADDISRIDRIEVMMRFIYENNIQSVFGIVGSAHIEENRKLGKNKVYRIKRGTFTNKVSMARIFLGMPFIHSSFIYRKRALLEIGGFATEVSSAIDYFTLNKIAVKYPIYAFSGVTVKRIIDGKNFFLKKVVLEKKVEVRSIIDKWQKENLKNYQLYKILKGFNEFRKI